MKHTQKRGHIERERDSGCNYTVHIKREREIELDVAYGERFMDGRPSNNNKEKRRRLGKSAL